MAVSYTDLINKSGTIYNTTGATSNTTSDFGYSDPNKLAADLGIDAKQIDWSKIYSDASYTPGTKFGAIAADTLTSSPSPTMAQPTADLSSANSLVAGATQTSKTLQDYINQLTPPPTALDTQNQALVDRLGTLYGQDTGKASALNQAEQDAGVTDLKKQLQEITNSINIKNAEYNQLGTDVEGKPITMASIIGSQAQIRRAQASEIGLLSARAQAVQGNLALALDTAQKAVNLKYAPIEEEITAKERQLQLIQPLLSAQQQKIAQAQALMLEDQRQRIADEKEAAATLQNIAINAASQGIPSNIINQALATKDPVKASTILSHYSFVTDNQIRQPFYEINGTVYRTSDGKAYSTPEQFFADGGARDWSNISRVDATSSADKDAVLNLRQKYPDAGILATDSFAVASSKLGNSRIYTEMVRPPSSGGGGISPYQLLQFQNSIQDNARQDPDVSQFTAIRGAYEQARQAVQQGNSAGDIVLMRTLAKITDPTTGVREEEYKTFQNAIGTLPRFGVQLTSSMIGKGQLTVAGRQALYEQVQNIYQQREAAYMNKIDFYQAQVQPFGGSIPFYTAPKLEPINFEQQQQQTTSSQGFFSKAFNWLFGN